MRSNAKKTFYFHADASSLGGFIEKPFQKHIPSQASAIVACGRRPCNHPDGSL